MSGKGVWLVLFLVGAGYWAMRDSTHNSTTATTAYSVDADSADADSTNANSSNVHNPDEDQSEDSKEFHGYPCTQDCSGHEAGYNWAEQHSINDVDSCDQAGETSNSPSFAEGCKAYVEENEGATDDDDR